MKETATARRSGQKRNSTKVFSVLGESGKSETNGKRRKENIKRKAGRKKDPERELFITKNEYLRLEAGKGPNKRENRQKIPFDGTVNPRTNRKGS